MVLFTFALCMYHVLEACLCLVWFFSVMFFTFSHRVHYMFWFWIHFLFVYNYVWACLQVGMFAGEQAWPCILLSKLSRTSTHQTPPLYSLPLPPYKYHTVQRWRFPYNCCWEDRCWYIRVCSSFYTAPCLQTLSRWYLREPHPGQMAYAERSYYYAKASTPLPCWWRQGSMRIRLIITDA